MFSYQGILPEFEQACNELPYRYYMTVSTLIQQIGAKLYLGKAGGWVKERAEARDFRRTADAITYCVTEQLRGVRVVMTADDPTLDTFYYPSGDPTAREELRELQRKAKALKRKRRRLVEQLRATEAEVAEQAKELPLRRKKKRERPPEEDLSG